MFGEILRKKPVMECLYFWRLPQKATAELLLSCFFSRFFKDTYLVEQLRTITSDGGSSSRNACKISKDF